MLGCCCKLILDVILMIYRCLLFIMKFTKAVPKTAATPAVSKAATKAPPKATKPAAPPKVAAPKKKGKAQTQRPQTEGSNKPPPNKVTLFS